MHRATLRRLAIPLAILAILPMAVQPATAGKKKKARTITRTLTGTYELTGDRISSRRVPYQDVSCAAGECRMSARDGQLDVGGVGFPPTADRGNSRYRTVTIRVWDDVDWQGQTSVRVCDSDFTTICSNPTVSQYACLKRGEPLTIRDVPRTKHVVVLVYAYWSCTQYVNDVPSGQGASVAGRVQAKFVWRK